MPESRRPPRAGLSRGAYGKTYGMTTRPTETPPAEGSTTMVRSEHANDANSGPVVGNRTPMVVTLVSIGLLVALMFGVVIYGLAQLG